MLQRPRERGWAIYSAATGLLIIVVFPTSFIVSAKRANPPGGLLRRPTIIGGWTRIAAVAWQLASSTRSSTQ